MARGFESKAVADQQEEAARRTSMRHEGRRGDAAQERERQRLELLRADLSTRLEQARPAWLRAQLEQALGALDGALAKLRERTP
jgi:hypothetical protein